MDWKTVSGCRNSTTNAYVVVKMRLLGGRLLVAWGAGGGAHKPRNPGERANVANDANAESEAENRAPRLGSSHSLLLVLKGKIGENYRQTYGHHYHIVRRPTPTPSQSHPLIPELLKPSDCGTYFKCFSGTCISISMCGTWEIPSSSCRKNDDYSKIKKKPTDFD